MIDTWANAHYARGMDSTAQLVAEIEAFLKRSGMSASYFGRLAGNDGKLVDRLRDGGSLTMPRADKIRRFMAEAAADSAKPSAKARKTK